MNFTSPQSRLMPAGCASHLRDESSSAELLCKTMDEDAVSDTPSRKLSKAAARAKRKMTLKASYSQPVSKSCPTKGVKVEDCIADDPPVESLGEFFTLEAGVFQMLVVAAMKTQLSMQQAQIEGMQGYIDSLEDELADFDYDCDVTDEEYPDSEPETTPTPQWIQELSFEDRMRVLWPEVNMQGSDEVNET